MIEFIKTQKSIATVIVCDRAEPMLPFVAQPPSLSFMEKCFLSKMGDSRWSRATNKRGFGKTEG
jgi:hypothetical protein